jgi:pyrimidine operon attenuation protein/uracil phosphoribosyltransferase
MPPSLGGQSPAIDLDDAAYAQPSPRLLYVHDDLSEQVDRRLGSDSVAAALASRLLAVLAQDRERVRVLTVAEQVERLIATGPHAPFDVAVGIGRAGQRVARAVDARTGWFPRVRRVGITRHEDGRGGYRLVSTEPRDIAEQLDGLESCASLAIVDDTIFSGLTMRGVIEALPQRVRARTQAFCLRGVLESIDRVRDLCPVAAGVAAPGRLLTDVSFINATGLVLRVAIRRPGQPPLAFFDRPEWIRAWFPSAHAEVLALSRQLNALLEDSAGGG